MSRWSFSRKRKLWSQPERKLESCIPASWTGGGGNDVMTCSLPEWTVLVKNLLSQKINQVLSFWDCKRKTPSIHGLSLVNSNTKWDNVTPGCVLLSNFLWYNEHNNQQCITSGTSTLLLNCTPSCMPVTGLKTARFLSEETWRLCCSGACVPLQWPGWEVCCRSLLSLCSCQQQHARCQRQQTDHYTGRGEESEGDGGEKKKKMKRFTERNR